MNSCTSQRLLGPGFLNLFLDTLWRKRSLSLAGLLATLSINLASCVFHFSLLIWHRHSSPTVRSRGDTREMQDRVCWSHFGGRQHVGYLRTHHKGKGKVRRFRKSYWTTHGGGAKAKRKWHLAGGGAPDTMGLVLKEAGDVSDGEKLLELRPHDDRTRSPRYKPFWDFKS